MRNHLFSGLFMLIFATAISRCGNRDAVAPGSIQFTGTEKVRVVGYTGEVMEPFLSREGDILFFNNLNDPSVNTDLHWAVRINDTSFEYKGQVAGINTTSLEGVASMDRNRILYFISTRSYAQTLASVYRSVFSSGQASNISLQEGISKNQPGWVNFDVEVNATGEYLYFVDGRFDQAGGPYEADIVVAQNSGSGFQRLPNSASMLKNINTAALEYAACISADDLELYFTRLIVPVTSSSTPVIYVAKRTTTNEPFGIPVRIESIAGFAEAATISPDKNKLYYHKKDSNGMFSLYLTRRSG